MCSQSNDDKPAPNFTMADLLEEITGKTYDALDEKLTTREMMPVLGVRTQKSVRMRIRPFVMAGILVVVKVSRPNMIGGRSTVPAYAVNPNKTKGDMRAVLEGEM